LVGPELEVPGLLHVYAIGDTAHVEEDGKLLPGVAPVAMQQGTYVGKRIRAMLEGKATDPFMYWDKGNLATIGRAYAIADFGRVRFSGLLGWLIWVGVHIFYLISFRNRLVVMMQWAWAYLTAQHGARLILGDQPETVEPAQQELEIAGRE
ncbi:MAG TPA: hypothetical protein VF807_09530, partial [Ktedonobacterales bacterium]